ncbi:hypothetical protein BS47DRAFT_1364649 [Hydnum rufescens UP504]|uniref:Uncharacterized protein n=1 Tax=Hydnum rufescens UP504 TaxID=1448309 RepID=A0A9P6ARH0_9AGAM|nr:hypothetical protein BS47DRAFT_1364649 [Hydnum rufescens UP504]
MPLDSVTHSQTRPSHPRNSQLQNAATPSIHYSNSVKPGPQHPTSLILLRRQQAHTAHLIVTAPHPHRPNPSLHLPEIYPPPDAIAVANSPSHRIKYFVAIDFGAVSSGVSYAASTSGDMHQILAWPGSSASLPKIPTCLVYDALCHVRAWGLEAKGFKSEEGMGGGTELNWIDRFKLWLNPSSAPRTVLASRSLQPPKNAVDVVADYLACLWSDYAEVYLTVPSAWDLHASLLLREAAIRATDCTLFRAIVLLLHDIRYTADPPHAKMIERQKPLQFIPSFHLPSNSSGTRSSRYVMLDLATYKILRALGTPKIAEVARRSGSYWGSLFLDLNFRKLVQARLAAHPVHLDEASLAHFVHTFSRSEKLAYKGPEDGRKLFRFRCLHGEDWDDPAVGLYNGELVIPGDVLRREVFDPVVKEVLHSIATHVQASRDQFGPSIGSIIRPADGDVASCRGGTRFGIGSLVSSAGFLPAEEEDQMMRPAYITNVAGTWFCERRVEYIVRRGAIVTKGSRSELRLRKFCSSRYDRTFDLVLYTSTGDQTRRYFDEEGGEELCRCRIDLETYPSFLEQAEVSPFGNFYVDFVLGFEMDSAVYFLGVDHNLRWIQYLPCAANKPQIAFGDENSWTRGPLAAPASADTATVWEIEDFLSDRTRHGIQVQIVFATPPPSETLRDLLLIPNMVFLGGGMNIDGPRRFSMSLPPQCE